MSIVYGNTTPTYMQIVPKWSSMAKTIIKAGTPLAADGSIANNANAVGILPNTVGKTDPADAVDLIVSGVLSLPAVESGSGLTIATTCKKALYGITFIKSNGTVDTAGITYTLPAATETAEGGVKMAANVPASEAEALADLVDDVNALLSSLKTAGIMAADPVTPPAET